MKSYIYFIKRSLDDCIKIGYTKQPIRKRMLSIANKWGNLELLGIIDGDVNREKILHFFFEKSNVSGEWFRPTDDLIEFIRFNTYLPDTDRPIRVKPSPQKKENKKDTQKTRKLNRQMKENAKLAQDLAFQMLMLEDIEAKISIIGQLGILINDIDRMAQQVEDIHADHVRGNND